MKTEVLEMLSRKHRLLLLFGFFCWVCICDNSPVWQLQFLLQSNPGLTLLQGPTAWAECFTDDHSFCLPQSVLASALAPEEWCFPPDIENLISVLALGLEKKAGHVTVMQCPQLAMSQPGMKVTSGASGLQVLLLTAVSYSLSSLQSLLPALAVLLPMLQLGWSSVPKSGSSSRGWCPCHHCPALPQHTLGLPKLAAASPRRSGHPNSKAPLCSYVPNTCWRVSRAHWDCALPEETGLVEEGFTGPSTSFEQLQTPQLGLELILSSDFTSAVGWIVLSWAILGSSIIIYAQQDSCNIQAWSNTFHISRVSSSKPSIS